jgi:hypothetical protein
VDALTPKHLATGPAMPSAEGATPVMAQFFDAKARQPDALVFFRMGDFYELFFEDARRAAEALGIALTFRGKHAGEDIPMCGVPVHAAEAYLAKLIRAGFKVAVCEQMEEPAEAKKRGAKSIMRHAHRRQPPRRAGRQPPGCCGDPGDARGSGQRRALHRRRRKPHPG